LAQAVMSVLLANLCLSVSRNRLQGFIALLPLLMILLLAMFLVGGGIFVHNVDFIHHLLADYQLADGLLGNVATLVVGVIVGAIACAIVLPAMKLFGKH
jgi:predicted DNA repair protein MutK